MGKSSALSMHVLDFIYMYVLLHFETIMLQRRLLHFACLSLVKLAEGWAK